MSGHTDGDEAIRFMTFNVRFDNIKDAAEGNAWADRKRSVIETVLDRDPDVIGFQEVLQSQLEPLTAALSDYRSLGKPRDIGETAEYVPLFFHSDRFELEEYGDFWLSPTPDVQGSRGWDTDVPRHCTWARLRPRDRSAPFAVFNTHLDVWGTLARYEAARLIVGRIASSPATPAVVLGDFNAREDSDVLDTFRGAGFRDTLRELHPDETDVQTVHHYEDLSGDKKIDYIMCDRRWRVLSAQIVREEAAGRLPSDHFPVMAELALVEP